MFKSGDPQTGQQGWRFRLMPFVWAAFENSKRKLSPAFICDQGNSVHALQLLF
jgi:hypothetical protein